MLVHVIRWFFLLGFVFLVGVGVWTIRVVTRMRAEYLIAMTMLRALMAHSGLKEIVAKIQTDVSPKE